MKKINFVTVILCLPVLVFSQVKITAGTDLTTTGNIHIIFSDLDFINDGVVNLIPSTIHFTGTGDNIINGAGFISFNNLTIEKTIGKQILIGRDITVNNHINFLSGLVELNNHYINLLGTGMLVGESENSRTTGINGGFIVTTAALHFPNGTNPGNLGAMITSAADMGNTEIRRGHISKNAVGAGGTSINRYFDFNPASNTSLNANVKFTYFNAELNGINENNLSVYTTNDGLSFYNINQTSRDANSNFVTRDNIDKLGIYTLSSPPQASLPVMLIGFNAQCKGSFVQLDWKTATEQNSDRFDVQRNSNGSNWEKIGSVKSAGNSSSTLSYHYDDHALQVTSAFYRLAQYDMDGRVTYSPIAKAGCGQSAEFKVMPNPVVNIANVIIGSGKSAAGVLRLYNASGQQVMQQAIRFSVGINQFELNMSVLSSGNYSLIFMQNGVANQAITVVKQ